MLFFHIYQRFPIEQDMYMYTNLQAVTKNTWGLYNYKKYRVRMNIYSIHFCLGDITNFLLNSLSILYYVITLTENV